jgi:hypothetical protein
MSDDPRGVSSGMDQAFDEGLTSLKREAER